MMMALPLAERSRVDLDVGVSFLPRGVGVVECITIVIVILKWEQMENCQWYNPV